MTARVLRVTGHRPWPLPLAPWIMAQRWHDMLFAHWALPAADVRPLVPHALPLDTFDGAAWVGIVPFRMTGVRPRCAPPLPWLSSFPELNVRTYVTLGRRPGVWFFSLDAGNRLAVLAARTLFHLPYFHATMDVSRHGDEVRYGSRRLDTRAAAPAAPAAGAADRAELVARYRPTGPARNALPGSLEHFLTERYCLYAVDGRGRVLRLEIHHPPWTLQPAEAEFETLSVAAPAGIRVPAAKPLLHFSRLQEMVAWAPYPAGRADSPTPGPSALH